MESSRFLLEIQILIWVLLFSSGDMGREKYFFAIGKTNLHCLQRPKSDGAELMDYRAGGVRCGGWGRQTFPPKMDHGGSADHSERRPT